MRMTHLRKRSENIFGRKRHEPELSETEEMPTKKRTRIVKRKRTSVKKTKKKRMAKSKVKKVQGQQRRRRRRRRKTGGDIFTK